jgi:hypothetical protein
MELTVDNISTSPNTHFNNQYIKHSKTKLVEQIINEYTLNKQHRIPSTKSPNLFIDKLVLRMQGYYNVLYNERNTSTE